MQLEFSHINLTTVPDLYDMINNKIDSTKFLKLNNIKLRNETNNTYKVIQYNKEFLSQDLIPIYGLCRSITVNNKNEVISFAPPKSVPAESFIEKYSIKNLFVVAEEFVEGTMINVFWDSTIGIDGAWEITTRNTVGATSSFYKTYNKPKTFRAMFLEACIEMNLDLKLLNKKYCYSFVLQHPENRIVVPFKTPELYLVSVFHIENNSEKKEIIVKTLHLDNISFANELVKHLGLSNTNIKFPKKIDTNTNTYSDIIKTYASMDTPYDILGVVIYNKNTGERMKIRNPVYEQVRQLRGNQPKLQYQYLSLRHDGKIKDFLSYFSENKKDFSEFRDQVHLFTNTLFSNYISCYIKKEKPLIEYSEQYRTHMFHLHKKYIDELKEKNLFITNSLVKKYVNDMHPSLLMYTLNYPLRKRNIELIKCEEI